MIVRTLVYLMLAALVASLAGCARFAHVPEIPVTSESVAPGTEVTRGGKSQKLLGEPVRVGQVLPALAVTDRTMSVRSLGEFRGRTLLVSIAPSLDTQVCERQTHMLGEAGLDELPDEVLRITITRDLPFAHSRFADHTGFENILYLSDYANAEFGKGTGLLLDELALLARAVMVVDSQGVIRHLQVVPEVGHLPDMDAAFAQARALAAGPGS